VASELWLLLLASLSLCEVPLASWLLFRSVPERLWLGSCAPAPSFSTDPEADPWASWLWLLEFKLPEAEPETEPVSELELPCVLLPEREPEADPVLLPEIPLVEPELCTLLSILVLLLKVPERSAPALSVEIAPDSVALAPTRLVTLILLLTEVCEADGELRSAPAEPLTPTDVLSL